MGLSTAQLQLIEQRVANDAKSTGAAYVLCLLGFFGLAGIHRFYMGRIGTGLVMLFTLGLFGFWTFIDLFLIPGIVSRGKDDNRQRLMVEMMAREPTTI